jgi:cysteine desulfurase
MQAQVDGTALCGPGLDLCDESGELVRLPGNANLTFRGVDGEALLLAMDHLAVSSGATCASSDPEPSHVLRGLGLDDDMARSSLRFGLGRFNTPEQVDFAVESVVTAVRRLRHLASA